MSLLRNQRADNDGPAPAPQGEAPRARASSLGELLRRTREGYGYDINQMASVLRIRASQIAAIEDGRYDRLPGAVYAQGFVRAYAAQLGLDGDEAVRRFKHETAGQDQARDLSFPMPLGERSIPGGRVLLVALVLAICGYGVWYYLSTGGRERPVRVAEVPPELAPPPAPAPPPPATGEPAAADTGLKPAADAQTAPGDTAGAAAPQPGGGASSAQTAAAVPAAAGPEPAAAPPAPAISSPVAVSAPAALPAAPASPPPIAVSAPAAIPPAPVPTAAPAPAPAPAAAPSASEGGATAVPAAAAATAAPGARVFGDVSGAVRVELRATANVWLQVRDADGNVVAQRMLHAGDIYRVPDRPGLVMTAGNASGLAITVDGRPAPALGGAVRHNVVLDPARLLAGTALE